MMKTCLVCLMLGLMLAVLAGCGGTADQATATAPPTQTPFPTFAFVEPTKPPVFDQKADEAAVIELNPTLVARGLNRYEALECAGCHGAGGEGTDKGGSLLDFALSEEDFITFMRSGGELGTEHQYSTNRLSNSGSRNLYQYLVSLAQGI